MERRKFVTVALTVAVVMIWGVIIIKVVRRTGVDEITEVDNPPAVSSANKVHRDSLRLDYRDPFLREFIRVKHDRKPTPHKVANVPKKLVMAPVPDFTFKGLIGNDSGQRAMVMKNGGLHIVGLGETIGGFKVVEFFPEYMTVQSGNDTVRMKVR